MKIKKRERKKKKERERKRKLGFVENYAHVLSLFLNRKKEEKGMMKLFIISHHRKRKSIKTKFIKKTNKMNFIHK